MESRSAPGSHGCSGRPPGRRQWLETEADPRAEELREKLVEARETLPEREAFEEAETPVDEAEPAAEDDLDERRGKVHEQGHAVAGEMRRRAKPKPGAETED